MSGSPGNGFPGFPVTALITYIDQIHSGGDGGSVNTMGLSNTKMYSLARITFITESRVENSTWEFSHDSIFFFVICI